MLQVGQLSIRRGLAGMTVWDLMEWCEHYEDEPWGWEIENFRMGQVCATVAGTAGKVLEQEVRPADFYPFARPAVRPEATPEQIEAFFQRLSR